MGLSLCPDTKSLDAAGPRVTGGCRFGSSMKRERPLRGRARLRNVMISGDRDVGYRVVLAGEELDASDELVKGGA